MTVNKELKDEIVGKAKWYLKYRTQLWAGVFMLIGIVGGNADRVKTWVPTLKYDTETIEQRLNQLDEISDKLIKIQDKLDKLEK